MEDSQTEKAGKLAGVAYLLKVEVMINEHIELSFASVLKNLIQFTLIVRIENTAGIKEHDLKSSAICTGAIMLRRQRNSTQTILASPSVRV